MRTQKLPGLSKASGTLTFSLFFLHYDLIYGASETCASLAPLASPVNYCLDYGISETCLQDDSNRSSGNYCLDYGTSETFHVMLTAPER